VAVESDITGFFRERLPPDTTLVRLACDELVDQKRTLRQGIRRLNQMLRDQIRHLVPETQDCGRLDAHHRSLRGNNIF
jgi:hypothetical protein